MTDHDPAADTGAKHDDETASPDAPHTVTPLPEPLPQPHLLAPEPKAWGEPVARFDRALSWIEERLLLGVVLAEILALVVWVALRGFSLGETDSRSLLLRGVILAGSGAAVFALAGQRFLAGNPLARHAALAGALLGGVVAYGTRHLGAEYFQNLLNWMQNASVLMLVGGLRGLVTRLTLTLALLGASIATSKGKHINIDVVMRFLPIRARVPVALIGWLAAALMCVTGAWGFADQLALGEFRVERTEVCAGEVVPEPGSDAPPPRECEVGPKKKLDGIFHEMGKDAFLLGRQISLDVKSLPKVLGGTRYDSWMTPAEWNAWMRDGGWERHYPADEVARQMAPEDATDPRMPAVNIPGGEENPSGILVRDLNLVLPFGLLMIALRFVLRSILALSGHVVVDPDAAHADDDDEPQPAPAAEVKA